MSLSVNYTSLYKKGIDTSILKEVSQEILRRAEQKSAQYSSEKVTNFIPTKTDLGVDLYQGKINTNAQKQIAMNNSMQFNLNAQAMQSIQYLNSHASIKNIDGKYMPAVNEVVTETQKASEVTPASHFMSIFSAESSKDKRGSNPFYHGELLVQEKSSSAEPEQTGVIPEDIRSIFS